MSSDSTFRVFLDNRNLPIVDNALGSYIYSEGRKLLDTTAGGTSYAILGWGHKQVNNALIEQISKFGHMDYKIWDDPNIGTLADIIVANAPKGISRVYFSGNSGAEACEAAMKMSFQAHQLAGRTQKKWFISRKQSYHGSTSDALVLGDRPNLNFFRPMLSPFRKHIEMHHYKKLRFNGESESDYASRCAKELERAILEIGPENVAAFVGETIMGGLVGDVPPVGDYWRKIAEVCKLHNVHLILDEVYCGTGTTGTYFSVEQDGITPDFVFMGKTLAAGYGAISAVTTTEEIYELIGRSPDQRLQHTTTHQAHSLGVAAALQVQQIVSQASFLNEVKRKGELFRHLLEVRFENLPRIIDIRGRGLRFSIEHNVKNQIDFGRSFEQIAVTKHNLLVNAKWHRICLTPPLIITDEEINIAVEAIVEIFDELFREYE